MNIHNIQRQNAITIARHRIGCGYYDSEAVIDETVRRVHVSLLDQQIAEEAREQAEFDRLNDGDRWEGQS